MIVDYLGQEIKLGDIVVAANEASFTFFNTNVGDCGEDISHLFNL